VERIMQGMQQVIAVSVVVGLLAASSSAQTDSDSTPPDEQLRVAVDELVAATQRLDELETAALNQTLTRVDLEASEAAIAAAKSPEEKREAVRDWNRLKADAMGSAADVQAAKKHVEDQKWAVRLYVAEMSDQSAESQGNGLNSTQLRADSGAVPVAFNPASTVDAGGGFSVTDVSVVRDGAGNANLRGKITNSTNMGAAMSFFTVSIYDESGFVIDSEKLMVANLNAGASLSFWLPLMGVEPEHAKRFAVQFGYQVN
jgi:hypothetical protein